VLLGFYRELLRLRRSVPALADLNRGNIETTACEKEGLLGLRRWSGGSQALAAFNFGDTLPPSLSLRRRSLAEAAGLRRGAVAGQGSKAPRKSMRTGKLRFSLRPGHWRFTRRWRTRVERFICVHGHFYQPPRENPWLEAIERQDSAYPYHDWNERISAECYRPNGASRIMDVKAA